MWRAVLTSTLDWARFYVAKRRWTVIPINVLVNGVCSCWRGPDCDENARGKHPAIREWQINGFNTLEQVDAWWQARPHYNIGLVTGSVTHTCVIDIDKSKGGFESFDKLESIRDGGPLPLTLTAATGGGGRHLIYQIPSDVHIRNAVSIPDFPGIDIRGDGGQIVLPPSIHRLGTRYTWDGGRRGDEPLEMLPDDMIELLTKLGRSGSGGGKYDLDKVIASGIVPGGMRNDILYAYACRQARRLHADTAAVGKELDITIQELTANVAGFNMMYCTPPVEQDEVMGRIQSALDWVRKTPGSGIDPEQEAWLIARRDDGDPDEGPQDDPDGPDDGGGGGPTGGGGGASSGGPPDADSLGDDGQLGNRTLTDNGNARRIVDYFGNDLRYTEGNGWHVWKGTHWHNDVESLGILNFARELPVRIMGEQIGANAANTGGLWDWAVKDSKRLANMKKSVELAETDTRIHVPVSAWDADDWALGVQNGVLDLRSGTLHPPARDQYITKRTALSYDMNARDYRWEIFIDQATGGDKEFHDWLQRAVGYTLTGMAHEEKFFVVYGPSSAGKSTLGAVVSRLLGSYSVEWGSDKILGDVDASKMEYYNAQLYGRRMLFVSEMPEAEKMKEDAIKRLSGGDRLDGRHPAGRPFQFDNKAKLWIATNHRPRVDDGAMWRRMVAVPFMYQNTAPDETLKPWLLSPEGGLPAILAWAVKGAVSYASNGLGMASVVRSATLEYKRSEDRLGLFLAEETRAVDGGSCELVQLHASFRDWERDRGEGGKGISRIAFEKKIVERGYEVNGQGRTATVKALTVVLRDPSSLADLSRRWG